ncbi:hypothetical protein GGR54DRAFT_612988 [Hypoxylon sp. NC1633]|nr:hypothetical protein GGR54DRAFT_612988 [Hypoxylon sp. NC1633]
MAPIEKKNDITEKEARVLAMAWKCFKTVPEVDHDKLAKLTGYANPRSVMNLLCGIRKKINCAPGADDDGKDGGANTPAKPVGKDRAKATPKATSGPRKRKSRTPSDSEKDEQLDDTPIKRPRSKRVRAKAAVKYEDDDFEKDWQGDFVVKNEEKDSTDGLVD